MKLSGYQSIVKKSAQETFDFLNIPNNFKTILPQNLSFFEADDQHFSFQLQNVPTKIHLVKKSDNTFPTVVYTAQGSIAFELQIQLQAIEDQQTQANWIFEGSLNPMLQMMVETPLKKLLAEMSGNLEQL